jgi:inorganic pyrophosphatase
VVPASSEFPQYRRIGGPRGIACAGPACALERVTKMNFLNVPIGARAPEFVNAVVEIPAGGVNKIEYDKKLGIFRLDRPLFSPVHYPGDYGFIPSTLAEDGDPLDIIIMVVQPTFTGCLVEARPVGMLEMLDQGVKDEKILAVASGNPVYQEVRDYTDVYSHVLLEIAHFFSIYKDLEGKRTKMDGWQSADSAKQVIEASHQRYLDRLKCGDFAL